MKNKPNKSKQGFRLTLIKSVFLVIIILSFGASLFFFLQPSKDDAPITYTEPLHTLPEPEERPPSQPIKTLEFPPKKVKPSLPKIAIIIDDIGYRKGIAESIIDIGLNLSYSILPESPYSAILTKKIRQAGNDLLLHLPLEPTDPKWDPGPGTLFLSMDKPTIQQTLRKSLAGQNFSGINHHMGSKFTADQTAMKYLMAVVQQEGLFYVDSLTSSKSVAYSTAKQLGVKTAKRNIFLDNEQTPEKISRQLDKLVALAKKRGSAIGIGMTYAYGRSSFFC